MHALIRILCFVLVLNPWLPVLAQEFEQVNTTSPQTLENKTLVDPTIQDATITGTIGGSPTLTSPTISNPTITGTVAGGASYTGPTITNPAVTGTVSGGASYTGPTITNPAVTGIVSGGASYTGPTLTSPSITGTVAGAAAYTSPTLNSATMAGTKQFSADFVTPENYSSSLATTISTIGVSPKHVALLQNYTVSASLTFPATMRLSIYGSGGMTCSTGGVVITINGPFASDLRQVFTLSGGCKVVFGIGAAPVLYTQWWGAKGDDTNIDGAITQAVLDSLSAGSTIVFPCGTYRASSQIVIPAVTNLNLLGSGSCTVLKNATANEGVFAVTAGADRLQIANMKLQGSGSLSVLGRGLIYVNPAGAATPTKAAHFHHLWLAAPSTSGISGNCLTDSIIDSNFFYNDGSAYGEHGAYLSNAGCVSARIKVRGNYMWNTTAGNSAGIAMRQWQDSEASDNTIVGWKYGLLPVSDAAGPPSNVLMESNVLVGQGSDGVNFFNDSGSTAPTRMFLKGGTIARAGRNGIRSDFVTDCTIAHIDIFDNAESGMRMNGMSRCLIEGNNLFDNDSDSNGTGGDDSSAIRLNSNNTNNVFSNNRGNVSNVLNFQKYGLSIGSTGNTGNTFLLNTWYPNRTSERDVGATTNKWFQMDSTGTVYVGGVDNALIGVPSDRGTCTFSAATSKVCSLNYTQPDNLYYVVTTCNADKNFWVNSKTTTTFTLNATPSSSDNCDWMLMR